MNFDKFGETTILCYYWGGGIPITIGYGYDTCGAGGAGGAGGAFFWGGGFTFGFGDITWNNLGFKGPGVPLGNKDGLIISVLTAIRRMTKPIRCLIDIDVLYLLINYYNFYIFL